MHCTQDFTVTASKIKTTIKSINKHSFHGSFQWQPANNTHNHLQSPLSCYTSGNFYSNV